MAARSVAEFLPTAFDDLDLSAVGRLVADLPEETLFFERKLKLDPDSLARTCAAFANTEGGLLLVGVPDKSDELVGIDDQIGEVEVWVKDVLRPRILPLPAFRARRFRLNDDRWLLLVLVERSSATPHLLIRTGAIYVRNPGSNDPVPINDQGRLLDLFRRGERALDRAREAVFDALEENMEPAHLESSRGPKTLAVAATGLSERYESRLLHDPATESLLDAALPPQHSRFRDELSGVTWRQHDVTCHRVVRTDYPSTPDHLELVRATRSGVVIMRTAYYGVRDDDDEATITRDALREWLDRSIHAAAEILLDLGAHGDAIIAGRIPAPLTVLWPRAGARKLPQPGVILGRWMSLGADRTETARVIDLIEAEVARATGVAPEL